MNDYNRAQSPLGTAVLGRASAPAARPVEEVPPPRRTAGSSELCRTLAEVKGQAQFLLYLADQLEDSLEQLAEETDPGHAMFLCKILGMYSAQLESKHVGLGDRISETCQEVYITVREHDAD
jgi:hypothetical protein